MIKIKNFNKYYNRRSTNEIHVINNTTLELPNTGLVCILGESGSGKTTLMNAIGGLDSFDSGELLVDDYNVKKYSSKKIDRLRNEKFGYIFQNYYLLLDRTVYYNIELALNMYELSPEEKEERILYVLKAVGMEKYRKRKVSQLSGGQQQRVAIARALAKTPNVIFADEPTGNLDEKNTIQIMNIIKKISKDCLVVLVTHEKRIAEFYADRIINIQDGKVVKDYCSNGSLEYSYEDDNNIYLKDMKSKESMNVNGLEVDFYRNETTEKYKINIVEKDGHIYISSFDPNLKLEVLSSTDEKKIIDDHKPVINKEDVENFEYELSRLNMKKAPRLTFKETLRLAFANFKQSRKKNLFMNISLFATSVITMICVSDLLSVINYDTTSITSISKNVLRVDIESGGLTSNATVKKNAMAALVENLEGDTSLDVELWPTYGVSLSVSFSDYEQLTDVDMYLDIGSVLNIDYISESDLLYGRMPVSVNEIVVDKCVLENVLKGDSVMKSFFEDYESFLGNKLVNKFENVEVQIVGICDTNDVTAYGTLTTAINCSGLFETFATLTELQAKYPGVYDDITLEKGEALLREDRYFRYGSNNNHSTQSGSTYKIVNDTIVDGEVVNHIVVPDEFMADIIIGDDYVKTQFVDNTLYVKRMYVHTLDKYSVIRAIDKYKTSDNRLGGVRITITDSYQDQIEYYVLIKETQLVESSIICGAVLIISIIVLFFTMKANAIKRIYDIGVYRSIGISKFSVYLAFIIEILAVSMFTTFIGALGTYSIAQMICNIPIIDVKLGISGLACFITIISLFTINVLIGILPVIRLLSMTPSKLTAKYDM